MYKMVGKCIWDFTRKEKGTLPTYCFARPAWYTFVSVWSRCSLGARLSPRTGGSRFSCLSLNSRGSGETRGAHQSLQVGTKEMNEIEMRTTTIKGIMSGGMFTFAFHNCNYQIVLNFQNTSFSFLYCKN